MELQCSYGDPEYLKVVVLKDALGGSCPKVVILPGKSDADSASFLTLLFTAVLFAGERNEEERPNVSQKTATKLLIESAHYVRLQCN